MHNNMNSKFNKEMDLIEHNDPKLIYTSENIPTYGTSKAFEEQFCRGCDCKQTCKVEFKCSCLLHSGAAYIFPTQPENLQNYVITISDNNQPIYECHDNCTCNRFCGNRLVQFGPRGYLQIEHYKEKGVGLTSIKDIIKGNFICEYAGEVITNADAAQRHIFNKEHKLMNYIICVNEKFGNNTVQTFIDPSQIGNIGRYLNHSCEPNCELFVIRVNNTVPKVCIFAKEDICAEQELTFDYRSTNNNLKETSESLVQCLCKSKSCRGYMPYEAYS